MKKIITSFLVLATFTSLVAQDLSTATHVNKFSIIYQDTNAEGITFDNSGSKMFVMGRTGNISEFALSTPFDITSASFVGRKNIAVQDGYATDISFNNDGTKLFMIGRSKDHVNEYNLSIPFNINTLSYTKRFSVKSQETAPSGLAFNSSGSKMFVIGMSGDDVNEYQLTTPFDVSSASYVRKVSVAAQDASPTAITFNSAGTKMYVLGNGNDKIYQYALSSAGDISTASFVEELSVRSQENRPTGIAMNMQGQLYIVGKGKYAVQQYQLQVSTSDPDNDGDNVPASQDCNDNDPNLTTIGATCNDGNANTTNDVVTANCACQGTANDPDNDGDNVPASQDCNDNDPNLTTIGASCNDGNANTINDVVTANCACQGTTNDPDNDGDNVPASQDCNDNDPNLTTIGATCNDGNANTTNDVVTANCACQGTVNDPDNDGDNIPASQDCNDNDPNLTTIGASCNDGNGNTVNDIVTANCNCQGVNTGGSSNTMWTDHTTHISYDKKVLIGTTANLPAGYSFFVEKGILAEKMKLALTNTNAWADYVFAEDYYLRPIEEVESFVKKNKHLPNVPSAKELGEKGIDVVTMNATLLRQIEELWLHVIDLKKENEELKKMILEKE